MLSDTNRAYSDNEILIDSTGNENNYFYYIPIKLRFCDLGYILQIQSNKQVLLAFLLKKYF